MKLYEWEIWHTYTSYIEVNQIDLEYAARRAVESGIAYLSLHRDGMTVWKGEEGIGCGESEIRLAPDSHRAVFGIESTEKNSSQPNGFAAEAWGQACYFRFNESRLFGTAMPLPHPYVRLFLGQYKLLRDDLKEGISLYPIIVLYETGVVIIEFRTISPKQELTFEDFISGAVNLFQEPFDRIEVSPGLSKLATRAWYHSDNSYKLHQRAALLFLERSHDLAVAEKTSTEKAGDFTFDLSPLSKSEEQHSFEQLSSLALTIFHTLAFVLGKPRTGLAYLFRGQRPIPEIGGFWSGRPHIHLIRFEHQQETAQENEDKHGAAFGSIMVRSEGLDENVARNHLPDNNRIYEDYACYISSALSLWVWSLSGLRQQEPWSDPNRGHLIYEHQATVELLEYGYMLHRSLWERINTYGDIDQILSARQNLLHLEQEMAEASHFGEIRDLLDRGWEAMGLNSIRSRIRESLEIREAQATIREGRISERIGRILSIIFGFIAVPPIAEQILKPLWKILKFPRPIPDDKFSLLLIFVSLLIVAAILSLLLRSLKR